MVNINKGIGFLLSNCLCARAGTVLYPILSLSFLSTPVHVFVH